MRTVVLNIDDDAKFHLLVSLLRELPFVAIEDRNPSAGKNKKLGKLPASMLHPVTAENFRMFGKDELHDR
uniref:Uncharacterized protein n=1 Tax=Candidatus Kentrum sp. FW TaxID=2126338 RepID=A0A450SZQ0_9GAMM|nr:MAG: hypothetical protein BECKFW1821A_GA0114235_109314 [Candidatus Kentron sp. FW]